MKIIRAWCGNGYVGCGDEDVFFYDDNDTSETIGKDLWAWAIDNAESYSYVHFGWDSEYTEEEWEEYLDDIDFEWIEISYEEYLKYCEEYGYTPRKLV